jgi:tRNA-2-methylthio-N6-dimethylallyladenosine synthase
MRRQVPERAKAERLAALQGLLDAQARAFNAACLGRRLPVLLEREGRHPGQLAGKSPYLQAVHVAASPPGGGGIGIGSILDVTIDEVHPHSLSGTATVVASDRPSLERRLD